MNVLIVEDDSRQRNMLESMISISDENTAFAVSTVADAMDVLEQNEIHLALVDWMLPKMNGLDLVRHIRQYFDQSYIYIVIITARSTQEDLLEGLQSGADEYLIKPISQVELTARIKVAERIIKHENDLLRTLDRMKGLADHDELTHVYNRRAFINIIDPMLDYLSSQNLAMSLIMVDADHFKRINDEHGHAVGDLVLRSLAIILRDNVRQSDIVARYGGEEFIVALPRCDKARAYEIAERIRKDIESRTLPIQSVDIQLSVSIGVVSCPPQLPNLENLFEQADHAMYIAKKSGRNRTVVYNPDLEGVE